LITKRRRPSSSAARGTSPSALLQLPLCCLFICCLFTCAAACVEPESGTHAAEPAPEQEIARQAIDTGEALEVEPGAGVGVALAYEGDGTWRLSTTCDTSVSGALCEFDVVVRSAGEDDLVLQEDAELEPSDEAFFLDPFALELLLETGEDLDEVTFSASPGAVLRLTVWLYDPVAESRFDWTRDPRLISWVGHGAVNWGAPTNPMELEPAAL
jgi:hypothetical protein